MPDPFFVTCPTCQRPQYNLSGRCHYCGATLYAGPVKELPTNVRYPITFTVDADNFEHARRIARRFRTALRDAEEFDGTGAKLLKLRDPAVSAGPSPRPKADPPSDHDYHDNPVCDHPDHD